MGMGGERELKIKKAKVSAVTHSVKKSTHNQKKLTLSDTNHLGNVKKKRKTHCFMMWCEDAG